MSELICSYGTVSTGPLTIGLMTTRPFYLKPNLTSTSPGSAASLIFGLGLVND